MEEVDEFLETVGRHRGPPGEHLVIFVRAPASHSPLLAISNTPGRGNPTSTKQRTEPMALMNFSRRPEISFAEEAGEACRPARCVSSVEGRKRIAGDKNSDLHNVLFSLLL
jgi:hypothetical protein